MRKVPLATLVLFTGLLFTDLVNAQTKGFTLRSPTIKAGGTMTFENVFNGIGCTGKNVSPALEWSGAPSGTKSFALTVYDPKAPTGSGWWHWVVINIPGGVNKLAANAGNPSANLAPTGSLQTNTDFGAPGYGGPCPPSGDKPHPYTFTVFALNVEKLELPVTASGAYVGFNLSGHTIAKAKFTAYYGR
jgi:Raf kinase inhibitor-like YbhB/YbcL family protein